MKKHELAAYALGAATIVLILLVALNFMVFGFGISALIAVYSLTYVNFKKSGHRVRGKERMILVTGALYLASVVLFRMDQHWTVDGIHFAQTSALFVFESITYLTAIMSALVSAFMPSNVEEALDNSLEKKGMRLNYDFTN